MKRQKLGNIETSRFDETKHSKGMESTLYKKT